MATVGGNAGCGRDQFQAQGISAEQPVLEGNIEDLARAGGGVARLPLQNVVALHGIQRVAGGQGDLEGKHPGALDRVINDRGKSDLLGADSDIIAHHRLDLRLDGFGLEGEVESGIEKTPDAEQALDAVRRAGIPNCPPAAHPTA